MSTFLLVHGAWHGGAVLQTWPSLIAGPGTRGAATWGWGALAPLPSRMRPRGDPTSAGSAERDPWEELDGFVLVGHSWGGMVITSAGGPYLRRCVA